MSGHRAIKPRKIIIGGEERLYSVTEYPDHIRVRCYGISKNCYADATFTWQTAWYINQYKPSLVALIYEQAIDNGWNPDDKNSRITMTGEDILPEGWSNMAEVEDNDSSSFRP